jgi:ribA/ribD-fused uncharacterized protein
LLAVRQAEDQVQTAKGVVDMHQPIRAFEGDLDFCSNFFVEPDDTTVEHEFQAAKTHNLRLKVKILSAASPGRAKRLGRVIDLRPDWEEVKVIEMRSLVLRKFWDHKNLAQRLLDTGDEALIEWNWWHDNFWGVCHCGKTCDPQEGLNTLGRILMDVRAVILSFK